MAASTGTIPVVDFKRYGLHVDDANTVPNQDLEKVAKEVYDAFSTFGFLYLVNHGIQQEKIDSVFTQSKKFFDLPVEEKKESVQKAGTFHGWVALERETLNPSRQVGDLKELFNFTPAQNGKWPQSLPQFKTGMHDMFDECKRLTERILDVLSISLKLKDREFLSQCHHLMGREGNETYIRSLFYPPLPQDSSVKPKQVRCGEHTDYGTVTLLFQDDIGGLEVENTAGEYVPATPIPGTVLVNIGDLMQRWTADELKATKHRVLIPEEEFVKKKSRQSIAFFIHPDKATMIQCLDGSNKYQPISSVDYHSKKEMSVSCLS